MIFVLEFQCEFYICSLNNMAMCASHYKSNINIKFNIWCLIFHHMQIVKFTPYFQ